MKCASCGAVLEPGALRCTFCAAPTPAAEVARQRAADEAKAAAQWQAAEQWRTGALVRGQLDKTASQSLLWSIAGVVLCCLPLGVVGIVQGLRAKGLAAKIRSPIPASATAGLVIGGVSCLTSVVFLVWAFIRSDRLDDQAHARIAELEKQTSAGAMAPALDARTACGLAEMFALEHGYEGTSGRELEGFECPGRVSATAPDHASLSTFRFRYGTTSNYDVTACFERGSKWFVKELRKGGCSSSAPADPGSATPAPSSSGGAPPHAHGKPH